MFSGSAKSFEVSIRLLDGALMRGTVVQSKAHGQSQSVDGVLSNGAPFLEFVSGDGQRKFIAKHQIAYVEPVEPLRKPVLAPPNDPRFADAFAVLGLDHDCSFEQAREAYHRLAKLYHPDSHAGVELPMEVKRYLSETFKQINTAFTEVRAQLQQVV